MAIPLTLYVTTSRTGAVAKFSMTSTSAATTSHTAGESGTSSHPWAQIVDGSGTARFATEPAFGTTPRGAAWVVPTLVGKYVLAGTWSRTLTVWTAAEMVGGNIVMRVGYRRGAVYTQVGSDITLSSQTIHATATTAATYTISGTLPGFIMPATGELYVELYLDTTSPPPSPQSLYSKIGGAYDKLVTPGYTPLPNPPMPLLRCQIALTGTIWTGTNWVTISSFVLSGTTKRGRLNELQRCEAGQATLVLTNQDGRFSPWNKNSPWYNQLPATDSNPTAGVGTWTATNATLGRTTATPRYGTYAWTLTASSAGTMSMSSDSATAATPGRTYKAIVWVKAATTARAVTVSILWKNSAGTVVQTTASGAVTDGFAWQTTPISARGVCPSGAVKKDVKVTVASAATGEVHDVACVGISDVTWVQKLAVVNAAWCLGQRAPITQATPIKITATWLGVTYPVFAGAVATWVPVYGAVRAKTAVKAYDLMHILGLMPLMGNALPGLQLSNGAVLQWTLATPAGTTRVADTSGNGHTGAVSGTLTFGEAGGLYNTTASTSVNIRTASAKITGTVAQTAAASIELVISPGGVSGTANEAIVTWGSGASRIAVLLKEGLSTRTVVVGHGTTTTATSKTLTASTTPAAAFHHIVLTRAATGAGSLRVTNTQCWTGTFPSSFGSTFKVGPAFGLVQCVAAYDSALTAPQITAHYNAFLHGFATAKSGVQIKQILQAAGIPNAALGTINTGTITCVAPLITKGQTQVLSTVQTAENTEQGMLYCSPAGLLEFASAATIAGYSASQATFANDGTPAHIPPLVAPIPAADDQTLWNFVPVGIQGAAATTTSGIYFVQTAASIARYGRRALTGYTGMYFASATTAKALAATLCTRYATPKTRVRAVSCGNMETTGKWLPQMLGLALLTYVTVKWQPFDGSNSPFTQKSQIQQITHTWDKERWTTTWSLSPVLLS